MFYNDTPSFVQLNFISKGQVQKMIPVSGFALRHVYSTSTGISYTPRIQP